MFRDRHGEDGAWLAVLSAVLPARAVAAGAPDVTAEVEAALAAVLARRGTAPAGEMP